MLFALGAAYSLLLVGLGLYGLKVLVFTLAYAVVRGRRDMAPPLAERPAVTVQLPLYNEPFVAARAVDAACRLAWPHERLEIQVLDDSTDHTSSVVDATVASWRARGVDVQAIRRPTRDGFKAGALAWGLVRARGEFVAVLDADFVPPVDFLERTVPHFADGVAAVQARWAHLNAGQSLVTRIQSVALDGYFVVEQTVRSRLGLFVNFNGTAGVWRREAILSAGGWQADSLAEDTDLSFRAQLAGWRVVFLPDVAIPAELPADLVTFKRQQRRWATGTTQLLLKLGPRIWRAPHHPVVRAHALLTLGGHLMQPLTLVALMGAPLALLRPPGFPPVLGLLAVLALAPPAMYAVALAALYREWPRRLAVYPAMALVALGMSLNGTVAVARALMRRGGAFERTPKAGAGASAASTADAAEIAKADRPAPVDAISIGEAALACYALSMLALTLALGRVGWAPLLGLFAAGYTLTAWLSLAAPARSWPDRARRRVRLDPRAWPRVTPDAVAPAARPRAQGAGAPSAGGASAPRGAARAPR